MKNVTSSKHLSNWIVHFNCFLQDYKATFLGRLLDPNLDYYLQLHFNINVTSNEYIYSTHTLTVEESGRIKLTVGKI